MALKGHFFHDINCKLLYFFELHEFSIEQILLNYPSLIASFLLSCPALRKELRENTLNINRKEFYNGKKVVETNNTLTFSK